MLVQCVKCDATAEFKRRSEEPRGAFAQAENMGWRCRMTVASGALWVCPECRERALAKAVSDAR